MEKGIHDDATSMETSKVDLDGASVNGHKSSLQCNISLWNAASGESLFKKHHILDGGVNLTTKLAKECATSLLRAQEVLPALEITSPQSVKSLLNKVNYLRLASFIWSGNQLINHQ